VSPHEIFAALAARESWSVQRLGRPNGARAGWWGMSPAAEAWLDQLVTWRELGFNFCAHRPNDYDRYESLPGWARDTLATHAKDPREHLYSLEQLERAQTHDPLWNAAQRQMTRDGWFHNYMRMLWGKKILEWSAHPRDALASMTHLMNKYSLDGRGPNACSGCFWTLGRYDRAWAPARPIFGMVRYMSSANTARKLSVKQYLERYKA
jgi:deoxyribodipyrimidine photo-lyase